MDSWTDTDRGTAGEALRIFQSAPVASWADLTSGKPILIVAPHADDETLGCGGLIAETARRGGSIDVAVLTDGARSHPNSRTHDAAAVRDLRETELRAALDLLGAKDATITFLRQPDGYLGRDPGDLDHVRAALLALIEQRGIETVFVTWGDDPHPDHKVAFDIVAEIGRERSDLALLAYPIWGLTLASDEPVKAPFRSALRYEIRPVKSLKHDAIKCFQSQLGAVILDDENAFRLSDDDIERFCGDFETFIDLRRDGAMPAVIGSVPTDHFDQLYAKSADPWNYVANDYEQDRFQKTIDALPARRFRRGCEIGCSIGVLTERLAGICDALIGIDCSASALEQARERLAAIPHVDVTMMRVPDELPEGRFDLVVFSEVLYFFSDPDLARLGTFVERQLEANGICIMVNFLGDTESPQSGTEAAEKFIELTKASLTWLETHRFDGFRIDVLLSGAD